MSLTTEVRNASYRKTQEHLGARQNEVLLEVARHPQGITAWELAEKLGRQVYVVRPRLTELEGMNRVVARGTRYNPTTERKESVWFALVGGQMELGVG